eukprot:scaffold228111_cov34-Tisochrysis_lutea.AAC.4
MYWAALREERAADARARKHRAVVSIRPTPSSSLSSSFLFSQHGACVVDWLLAMPLCHMLLSTTKKDVAYVTAYRCSARLLMVWSGLFDGPHRGGILHSSLHLATS